MATDPRFADHPTTSALVIGGSLAGMCAARVLSDFVDRVTIIERDAYPSAPDFRPGSPQARHVHNLLARRIGIPKHVLRPRERTPWSPPAPLSPATPPERLGARRCTALRGLGWCWTDAAGWGRVAPQGGPGATASGRATGKAWGTPQAIVPIAEHTLYGMITVAMYDWLRERVEHSTWRSRITRRLRRVISG